MGDQFTDAAKGQRKETREEQFARERKEATAKAKAVWEKSYKSRKPSEKSVSKGFCIDYTFDEGTVVKDDVVIKKRTEFRFFDDGNVMMWKCSSKSQRFLVVSGPKAGQRITDDNPEYVLYNINGSYRGAKSAPPRCVLVHRASLRG